MIPFLVLFSIPIWVPLGPGQFLAGPRRPGMCAATGLYEIQNVEPMADQVTGRHRSPGDVRRDRATHFTGIGPTFAQLSGQPRSPVDPSRIDPSRGENAVTDTVPDCKRPPQRHGELNRTVVR